MISSRDFERRRLEPASLLAVQRLGTVNSVGKLAGETRSRESIPPGGLGHPGHLGHSPRPKFQAHFPCILYVFLMHLAGVSQVFRITLLRSISGEMVAKKVPGGRQKASMGAVGPELFEDSRENQHSLPERGTESGTLGSASDSANAVAAMMRLPLSDSEKAEAVRRLLGRGPL